MVTCFYSDLYQKEDVSSVEQMVNTISLSLSEAEKEGCKGPLTVEELSVAVGQLKCGNSGDGWHTY